MLNIFKNHYNEILKALYESFQMMAIALIIGVVFGLIIGVIITITSNNHISPNKTLNNLLGLIVNITRSIPFILLAIILIPVTRFIVGRAFGTMAGSVPLSIISIALFARFTEQALKEVSPNIIKSALAMGASKLQIVKNFMLKEARSSLILGYTSAIISIISYTTAMGILGAGGIGDFAIYHGYNMNNYQLMFIVIIIIFIIVQIIQLIGNYLANKLNKQRK